MILLLSLAHAGPYEALRARDGYTCTGTRDELLVLAESSVEPAYVPMRAAECVIRMYHSDAVVQEKAVAWMTSEQFAGLGLLVANRIDDFDATEAVKIVARVTDERFVKRLKKSSRPEVVDAIGTGR